jgi:hypothetical protein
MLNKQELFYFVREAGIEPAYISCLEDITAISKLGLSVFLLPVLPQAYLALDIHLRGPLMTILLPRLYHSLLMCVTHNTCLSI